MSFFKPSQEVSTNLHEIAQARLEIHLKENSWQTYNFSLSFYKNEDDIIGEVHYSYLKEDEVSGFFSEIFKYVDNIWIGINII